MPNCFTLTRKGEDKPTGFAAIDDEMCEALGVPCDEKEYYLSWYDIVGLQLALGWDWERIRADHQDWPEMLRVVDWLEANFVSDAWAER